MPPLRQRICLLALAAFSMCGRAQSPLPERSPFYIAPVIEGLSICVAALRAPAIRATIKPSSYCGRYALNVPEMVTRMLDELEPGGAAGQVRVGYTTTIQLLSLYEKKNGRWVIDTAKVDDYLNLITKVDRPVVIYLAANHFDTQGPLSQALLKDPRNLMQLSNGAAPTTSYFGYPVTPFTLLTDDSLPVNQYRFEALRHIAQKVARLPAAVQSRIIAVTLAGELHQMFDHFESGMGIFDKVGVTDYSPASIAQFRLWLARKYQTVAALNQASGFTFASFDAVPAPGKNLRTDKLAPFAEHYDGFAGGTLPVSGWLSAPDGPADPLKLYVDGRFVADVPRNLNRLDVYRAVPDILTPNVGFRYDFAYDKLPAGRHAGQVVLQRGDVRYLVARFDFNVMPRDRGSLPSTIPQALPSLEKLEKLNGVRASLDIPQKQQDLYFNPLARDWNEFRAEQVYAWLAKFHGIALKAGIPANKLYSHQIVPEVNSTWNAQLFAVGRTFGGDLPWHVGLNMYGGAVDSDWVRSFLTTRKITDYGVPEFNPQQWKRPGAHLDAMLSQYRSGARFISPYFISVTSTRPKSDKNAVSNMEIRPDNEAEGSAAFYQAIREFAAH